VLNEAIELTPPGGNITVRTRGDLGLGLAIVRPLVALHEPIEGRLD
jgi:hypothetical protein